MYQELIDDAVRARAVIKDAERGEDTGEWHPSGMNECLRAAVYGYTGVLKSDKKDVRNLRIMDRGTEVHEDVQALMHAKYPGFLSEVKVDSLGLKGSADGLLPVGDVVIDLYDHTDPPELALTEPVYELQEYKSISPNGKRYLKGQPKAGHTKQARMYYAGLENQGYLLDGIRIIYFDRDDWSVLEFEVEPWTESELSDFLTEKDNLEAHVAEGTLPDRMPDDFWLCRFCDWRTTCKGD